MGKLLEASIRSISFFFRGVAQSLRKREQKKNIQVFCFFVQFAGGVGSFSVFALSS